MDWLLPAALTGVKAASPALLAAVALRLWWPIGGPSLLGRIAVFGLAAASGLWLVALSSEERRLLVRSLRS
jgi:hypothetical protein